MSYTDGIAAINLEMPPRVPRTEYSVEMHYDVIKAVTGIVVSSESSEKEISDAANALRKAWNFDFIWNIRVGSGSEFLGKYYTDMGHANYNAVGSDFRHIGKSAFNDEDDVLAFDAVECLKTYNQNELVEMFNNDYRAKVESFPDAVNMTGIYITCMSGLIDLFGWDLLLAAAGVDPKGFGRVTQRYTDWIMQFYEALAKCNSPVVMVHDDITWTSGAFLHPEWYRQYVFPSYKKIFSPLLEQGKKIIYTSDGNFTEFVDDIAECGVAGFVMEPCTDMKCIADKYGNTHSFIGNADTRILLSGTKDDIYQEVKRCMDIGKSYPGFFMAVGNHIPPNTPIDNVLYYNDCYEKMSRR